MRQRSIPAVYMRGGTSKMEGRVYVPGLDR
jgi:2-methylaconitate cis-trans-isomerase PrpF